MIRSPQDQGGKPKHKAGSIATLSALKYLDTDGSAIEIAGEVMRTKGERSKAYQTPYGEGIVNCHVYQRLIEASLIFDRLR